MSCFLWVSLSFLFGFAVLESSVAFSPQEANLSRGSLLTQLDMAKTAKKKKKKKSVGGNSGGLKGFGGVASTASSSKGGNVEIDRSASARSFYDFLDAGNAGDTLTRCALGYTPLDSDSEIQLRGVIALKDIKPGDPIIRIPYELAINLGSEGADPTIPALTFLKEYCEVLGGSLDPADSRNVRKPYMELLPGYQSSDCLGSTDFFSEEALEALQSPLIVEETKKRRELTRLRFDRDVKGSDENYALTWLDGTPLTVDHLQWAVWLITSRVLTVEGAAEEGGSYRLLIPFLDMCNHDRTSSHVLSGRATPGSDLKVVAGSTVKEGAPINICYGGGMAGNDRFLQDYGFLDTSDNAKAYKMVAQQLIGKRRIVEGIGAGRLMSEPDRIRTLTELEKTSIEEDLVLLERTADMQLKAAYTYRIGVKQALAEYAETQ